MVVLRQLKEKYDITYGVVIPFKNSNFTKEDISSFCLNNGIKFMAFDFKYRLRDPRLLLSSLTIIRAIKKARPDVIYYADFGLLYLNIVLLLINRSKTIIALHDVQNHSRTRFGFLVNLSKKILIYNFSHFHTFSGIQQRLLKNKVPQKSVYNISLPLIDYGPVVKRQQEYKVVRFLFFGNILYYKGLDLLLKAFNRASVKYANIELIIAGRCEDWDEKYMPLVKESGKITHHIRFIGNEEIAAFFMQTEYLVLPYRDTTQSGPMMISYNYNIPVLVSRAEGFKEFTCENVTGYSFDLYKENDLERRLGACAEMSSGDYDELKGRLRYYTQKQFSIKEIISKYEEMFGAVQE